MRMLEALAFVLASDWFGLLSPSSASSRFPGPETDEIEELTPALLSQWGGDNQLTTSTTQVPANLRFFWQLLVSKDIENLLYVVTNDVNAGWNVVVQYCATIVPVAWSCYQYEHPIPAILGVVPHDSMMNLQMNCTSTVLPYTATMCILVEPAGEKSKYREATQFNVFSWILVVRIKIYPRTSVLKSAGRFTSVRKSL